MAPKQTKSMILRLFLALDYRNNMFKEEMKREERQRRRRKVFAIETGWGQGIGGKLGTLVVESVH